MSTSTPSLLPIIRISIIRKTQFFEEIRRSRLKKIKLPFKIRSPNVTHGDHDFFGQVRFTHLSDLEKKVETGN